MPNVDWQGCEEGVNRGAVYGFGSIFRRRQHRVVVRGKSVDLIRVEDVIGLEKPDGAGLILSGHPVLLGLADLRVVDAEGRGLALAHLPAKGFGLPVGHPVAAAVAHGVSHGPQEERVDARIGRAAMAKRPPPALSGIPRPHPGHDALLELGKNEGGDFGGDVAAGSFAGCPAREGLCHDVILCRTGPSDRL